MEQEDVQRVALDPLAAVEETTQVIDRLVHRNPERVLHRVAGAQLVGDRADPADAGGDVRRLHERAPAQERLEEARRLVDAQLQSRHVRRDFPSEIFPFVKYFLSGLNSPGLCKALTDSERAAKIVVCKQKYLLLPA